MSEIESKIIAELKKELSGDEKISQKLSEALCEELIKDSPNIEKLTGIIQLKKEYLSDD